MFWIGFIVGMVVLALITFGYLVWCFKSEGIGYNDYDDLSDTFKAILDNRDSRVEVYDDNTNERVFKAEFKYPWTDDIDE